MHRRLVLIASAAWAGGPLIGRAQTPFPNRPLKMIVPFPPGGGVDVTTRIITERLGARLGQPVIIDNRAGASGSIGADAVAKSPPDGYVLLSGMVDTVVNNAALLKTLPYDPMRDLVAVTEIVTSPVLVSVSARSGAKTLPDFIAMVKRSTQKLSYGSWGVGSTGHLVFESVIRQANADLAHVPYRGDAPVIQDLLANTIAAGVSSVSTAQQHVEAGSIHAVAVSGTRRTSALPGVPTLAELGFTAPIFEVMVWQGIFAPAGTPDGVLQLLNREIRAALSEPEVTSKLRSRSFDVVGTSSAEFDSLVKRDFKTLTSLIRSLGIEAQ